MAQNSTFRDLCSFKSVTNSAFFTKKFSPSTSGSSKSASTPEPVKTNDAPFRSNKPPYQWIDFSAVECQICKKKVNMGSRCPYRYYPSKYNPQSRRKPQANSSLQVHTSNLSEHSVFPAAGSWLPDSAATSYMTPDVSLLINPTTYTESEKVMVGNNFHIPISLVGSAILHTPTKSFTLSNVLFVPNLTQNLISVGVFTAEHNCKIGFTPWGYEITDLDSQLVLAEGVMHQNLYHIASKPSVKALTSIVASPSV